MQHATGWAPLSFDALPGSAWSRLNRLVYPQPEWFLILGKLFTGLSPELGITFEGPLAGSDR
jgi:hypothetical protein